MSSSLTPGLLVSGGSFQRSSDPRATFTSGEGTEGDGQILFSSALRDPTRAPTRDDTYGRYRTEGAGVYLRWKEKMREGPADANMGREIRDGRVK